MNYKHVIIGGVSLVSIIAVGLILYFYNGSKEMEEEDIVSIVDVTKETIFTTTGESFYVDVKGSVKKPGVYKVTKDMIVSDAIYLAGGLTKNAYTDNINLSQHLRESLVIYVYSKSEMTTLITTTTTNEVSYVKPDPTTTTTKVDGETTTKVDSINIININTASKDELLTLTGIGESKADAIIEYRSSNPFKSIDEITNVTGIGDSLFAKIKDYITV